MSAKTKPKPKPKRIVLSSTSESDSDGSDGSSENNSPAKKLSPKRPAAKNNLKKVYSKCDFYQNRRL